MTVRFTKGDGKPDSLTCIRDDGTRTWSPVGATVGPEHDLAHYAVETTLAYRDAFLGMLAAGRDIADFGTKNGIKDVYPTEAIVAEHLVGLIQLSLRQPLTTVDIIDQFAASLNNAGITAPDIEAMDIDRARENYLALIDRWRSLLPGESMDLPFPTG